MATGTTSEGNPGSRARGPEVAQRTLLVRIRLLSGHDGLSALPNTTKKLREAPLAVSSLTYPLFVVLTYLLEVFIVNIDEIRRKQ
jgi:hypothetical protein